MIETDEAATQMTRPPNKRNKLPLTALIPPADLMIEMEDHTNDLNEGRIPFLDYKTYTDRVFFLPSKDGANDVMITGRLDIPVARRAAVTQALNQFSNLLNSKTFLINVSMACCPAPASLTLILN